MVRQVVFFCRHSTIDDVNPDETALSSEDETEARVEREPTSSKKSRMSDLEKALLQLAQEKHKLEMKKLALQIKNQEAKSKLLAKKLEKYNSD